LQQEESQEKATEDEEVFNVANYADKVLETILIKSPDIKIVISSREGKCLTATVNKAEALETMSCVLEFTDKVKVLVKRLLGEELEYVSIKGRKNEILVTTDEFLEIITIRNDNSANK
jgi:predicted regulator of Ras-like GTPase activity (Roadblock/LC7/MglB family)